MRASPQPNQEVESVQRYMDCVDVDDEDEVALVTTPHSNSLQKPIDRVRKSSSTFSFNTIHSPKDTAPKQRRTLHRNQNVFADLI